MPIESADFSEYHVPPKRMLLHHPRHGASLELLTPGRLGELNFLALPHPETLYTQYDAFVARLTASVEPLYLDDVLQDVDLYRQESAANPNLIFVRDSSVTLPWSPGTFVPTRPFLPSRRREAELVALALTRLGLVPVSRLDEDEFLEGGDVLPVTFDGMRVLLVGFGVRTTKAAAIKLALDLIPTHVDRIIGLMHDPDLLHLDTGFTVLPNRVILAAGGMFSRGFLIDEERRLHPVDPLAYGEELGCRIIRVDKEDAIVNERCNLLPLGNRVYLAFDMPEALRVEIETVAGVRIVTVAGSEIAKATGGAHCLTRPLYS